MQTTTRKKPPFGIAQIGKSFRNEITPGNFIFRTREFEQMEMEFFVPPEDARDWFEYWCQERLRWYIDLGIPEDMLRLRPHETEELSHYSAGHLRRRVRRSRGAGASSRASPTAPTSTSPSTRSLGPGPRLLRPGARPRYVPYVIEPAAGADRAMMAFLLAAYDEEDARRQGRQRSARCCASTRASRRSRSRCCRCRRTRSSCRSPTRSPALLRPHFMIDVDDAGSIGRRYRRQDEIGTPLCVTVDFESLEDHAVTVRDRDTMTQDRVPIDGLLDDLRDAGCTP